ncbi:aminotransferase class I/II-fold pyridoxal phosphate-dependent enzyme [Agrobacterium rhizogenes]|uniref:pyridoxal phosphate-dependent decarboxylase family protein n=1 Tax=Rhizobium rhizogenes TaxID=359 RepID=UPI0015719F38|nr:aminotransferase class I/II-fold pyridoxal phosphate-dependent enzyme [Rhizobium rhizogenes]NTG51709.1 aminotransferase class I/II-fold pyridoxal phosphate-dependent enzyme [Rhizobium rhizogenes]
MSINNSSGNADFGILTANDTSITSIIGQIYSADNFAKAGDAVVHLLSQYLKNAQGRSGPVLAIKPPLENVAEAREALLNTPPVDPGDMEAITSRASALIGQFLANTQTVHHPGYIGHQLPPPLPMASLFELAADVANQGMAIYELGPWATAVEKVMVERLGVQLGFKPSTFSGLVTSGGTLANLTALLSARNKALDGVWKEGLPHHKTSPVIIAHRESHYSIERAAGILGIGSNQCLYVKSDSNGRTDPDALAELLQVLKARQIPIIAVVASACATKTGSFDSLPRIADLCEAHDVWLHVDAAHGGAVSFSPDHRHLLEGIDRADSVVWDAHKMLFVPTLSTYLFYRRSRDKYFAFSQDARYLFAEGADEGHEYDCGLATAECTKRAAALSLWGILSIYGDGLFETLIKRIFETTSLFVESLSAVDEIEIPIRPEFNIVLFRYIPRDKSVDLNDFNKSLRKFIIDENNIYLTTTIYNEAVYLRFVVMNPRTDQVDVENLMENIRRHASRYEAIASLAPEVALQT